ncbi:MAG: hypothetical protein P1U39_01920 [Legionellaceae bacterium]|nr:hypothetical protein [Legionellaceae bacterium]
MAILLGDKDRAFSCLSPRAKLQIKLTEARTDDEKLLVAIEYNEPSLVKFYLETGVSANSPEGSNTSPIFFAAVHKNPLITKMLLAYGANPNFEHRLTHSTILGSVLSDYDRLMQFPVLTEQLTEQLNKLVMIAVLMQHAGLRFDTPNSRNESPLDKFGLWVGPERKEQVLGEFLDKIAHADINTIRSADVISRPPEAITQLSSEEEQQVTAFRAGRYAEILNEASTRFSTSRLVAGSLLNRFQRNQGLDRSAAIRMPMGMPIDRLGLAISVPSSASDNVSRGPRLGSSGVSILTFIRLAESMQQSMQSLVMLAQLMELNRLTGHGVSSASQTNNLSSGPNAKVIEDIGFPSEEIPDEYICPLSLQIMSDPVYLAHDLTEQRFERTWLTKWLSDNGIHPSTRQPFELTAIQSDAGLKTSIDDFMSQIIIGATPHNAKR